MAAKESNPIVNFQDPNGIQLQALRVLVAKGNIADPERAAKARVLLASVDAKMHTGMARDEAMYLARREAGF